MNNLDSADYVGMYLQLWLLVRRVSSPAISASQTPARVCPELYAGGSDLVKLSNMLGLQDVSTMAARYTMFTD